MERSLPWKEVFQKYEAGKLKAQRIPRIKSGARTLDLIGCELQTFERS